MGLFLGGCADDLLPDELVVGVDVPAEVVFGDEGDRYGASVAWTGEAIVAAPGGSYVDEGGERRDGPSDWVGAVGDAWVSAGHEEGGYYVLRLGSTLGVLLAVLGPDERVFSAGADVVWIGGGQRLRSVDLSGGEVATVAAPDVVAMAADPDRLVVLRCADSCEALAFDPIDGASLPAPTGPEGEPLLGGEGGAVALLDGIVCVGDPMLDDDDGRGRVSCEDGTLVEGEPGDQIGQAIAAGYTVGTFNKWVVPARARVLPLWAGDVYAIEHGAESQPMALAGDDDTLLIGAPYEPHEGATAGAAYEVAR